MAGYAIFFIISFILFSLFHEEWIKILNAFFNGIVKVVHAIKGEK